MLLIIVATVVLNVLGQSNPEFYGKQDYENRDFQQRYPSNQGIKRLQTKEQQLIDKQLSNIDPAKFEELDRILDKYNKYEEFKKVTDQIKERTRKDPSRRLEVEVDEALQWAKKLDEVRPNRYTRPQWQPREMYSGRNNKPPSVMPSAGMNAYWSQPEQENVILPTPGPNTPQKLTGRQIMHQALRALESIDTRDNRSPMEKFPEVMKNLPKSLPIELLNEPINTFPNTEMSTNTPNKLPKMDDYNSPIRWVALDSNDTSDGLAKVTDPYTGRNQQFVLNDRVFVPVIDYNIERLGITTTHRPVLTTNKYVLQAIQRSVDFKNVDARDWLAFETVLGGRNQSRSCDGDSCQSRCKSQACESMCTGDTCSSGCIGGYCNTFCKGPGCLSMCIGESCTAKCEGISCDTRCRGKGCQAGCRTFSCSYAINGIHAQGGGVWSEHYPQYDYKTIQSRQY